DRQDREGDRRDRAEGDEEAAALRPVTARTAEVAVFAGIRGPARTFSYLVPDGLDLLPGHLVRVGLGQRAVPGVVVALDGAAGDRELRPVDALVHPSPLLRPHQLALAKWIAERYRCGLARCGACRPSSPWPMTTAPATCRRPGLRPSRSGPSPRLSARVAASFSTV